MLLTVFGRGHMHKLKKGAVIVADIVKSIGDGNISYFLIGTD